MWLILKGQISHKHFWTQLSVDRVSKRWSKSPDIFFNRVVCPIKPINQYWTMYSALPSPLALEAKDRLNDWVKVIENIVFGSWCLKELSFFILVGFVNISITKLLHLVRYTRSRSKGPLSTDNEFNLLMGWVLFQYFSSPKPRTHKPIIVIFRMHGNWRVFNKALGSATEENNFRGEIMSKGSGR